MSFSPVILNEGVRYTHVNTGRGKTDSVYVSFTLPLTEKNIACVTLVSKILMRGTRSFPDTLSICRECEDNYDSSVDITYQKRGRRLIMTFMLSYLRNRFAFSGEDIAERAVKMLSEFIFAPYLIDGAFDAEYTEREKTALCAQIASLKNNKPAYASYRAVQLMCEGEPFAISLYNCAGTIRALTPEDLTAFFDKTVKHAPVDIVYAGDSEYARMLELIKKHLPFGGRKAGTRSVIRGKIPVKVKRFTEETDASQSTLVMGFRTRGALENKDHVAFLLFGALLSLSPVSKLFMNVREKLSLCYYCNANTSSSDKIMMISAGIDAENSEKAQKAILRQIDDIANGRISREELGNAVKHNVSTIRSMGDDSSSLCSFYLSRLLRGRYHTPEEECAEYASVTAKSAERIAKGVVLDTVFLLRGKTNANNQKKL